MEQDPGAGIRSREGEKDTNRFKNARSPAISSVRTSGWRRVFDGQETRCGEANFCSFP
jgi:hypothetical protein